MPDIATPRVDSWAEARDGRRALILGRDRLLFNFCRSRAAQCGRIRLATALREQLCDNNRSHGGPPGALQHGDETLREFRYNSNIERNLISIELLIKFDVCRRPMRGVRQPSDRCSLVSLSKQKPCSNFRWMVTIFSFQQTERRKHGPCDHKSRAEFVCRGQAPRDRSGQPHPSRRRVAPHHKPPPTSVPASTS